MIYGNKSFSKNLMIKNRDKLIKIYLYKSLLRVSFIMLMNFFIEIPLTINI